MNIDVELTNGLFKLLTELKIDNVKDVLQSMTVKNEVVCLKLETLVDKKVIISRLKAFLKKNYEVYKFDIVINNRRYKFRHPTFYHFIIQSSVIRILRVPFYYTSLISLTPPIVTAFWLKYTHVSSAALDISAKAISDNFINVCFLLSTLIITYLITKVVAIKQEKNSRIIEIRKYSNQLTEFRRICRNLILDASFFTDSKFKQYAQSIKYYITFNEVEIGFQDDTIREKINKYIVNDDYSEVMLKLYLQLYSFYLEDGFNPISLLATHPDNYIYNSQELSTWESFIGNNMLWYVFDNERGVYDGQFSYSNTSFSRPIISSAKRFNSEKYKKAQFDSDLLLDISLDVQYEVLPNLLMLVKKNEEGLPFVFGYFISCFGIIVLFGVVMKTFFDLFYPTPLIDLLSIIITIMVLIHMSISLKFILRDELYMNTKTDYV